jgi:predicted nucleic acid-binding protein
VLAELADAMCRPRHRGLVVEFIRNLQSNSRVKIVSPSQDLFDRGLDLYSTRQDKSWSLTDCISFVVMQNQGLTEALTADHDFEQAGFTVLM